MGGGVGGGMGRGGLGGGLGGLGGLGGGLGVVGGLAGALGGEVEKNGPWTSELESQAQSDGEGGGEMEISPVKQIDKFVGNGDSGSDSDSFNGGQGGKQQSSSPVNVDGNQKAKRKLNFQQGAKVVPTTSEMEEGYELEKNRVLASWSNRLEALATIVKAKFETNHVKTIEYNYTLEFQFDDSSSPVFGADFLEVSVLYSSEKLLETIRSNLDTLSVQFGGSTLRLKVCLTFNCCGAPKKNENSTRKKWKMMGILDLVVKELMSEEIVEGEDIGEDIAAAAAAADEEVLHKVVLKNLGPNLSRHLPLAAAELQKRSAKQSRHGEETGGMVEEELLMQEGSGASGGEGGIEMFGEEAESYQAGSLEQVVPPVMVQVSLSKARKEYFLRLHHFEVCLSSHFAFVVKKMAEVNQKAQAEEGVMLLGSAQPAGRGRIRWLQKLRMFGKNFKFEASRVLSFNYKARGESIKSSLFRVFVKDVVLQSANGVDAGRVQFFFNEEVILAKGLYTFQCHVLEYVRSCMAEARLIKGNVKQTTIADPPKTVEQMINEYMNGKGKNGSDGSTGKKKKKGGKMSQKQFHDGAFAVWQATNIPASGRGKVGALASKDVVEKGGNSALVMLKYLALLITNATVLSFVQSAIMLAEKEVAVTIAALQRNQDTLRIMSMSGNKDTIYGVMVQIKRVLDQSIPTFEKLIQYLYGGMLHDLRCEKDLSEVGKELTCVERRQMLFSSGILIEYLQGSLHGAITFFLGGQRSQVYCKLQQISLRVGDEVDMARLGELIVAGIMFMNGCFYFLISADKVWRWSTAMVVPVPQCMTLILTLMYQFQIYIVYDRQKQFSNVAKAQMAASAMVAKTADKLLPKENGQKKKKKGNNGNNLLAAGDDENDDDIDASGILNHPQAHLLFSSNMALLTGQDLEGDQKQFSLWRDKWDDLGNQSSFSSESSLKDLQNDHLLSYLNHDMSWTKTQHLQMLVQSQDIFGLMVNVLEAGPLLDVSLFLDPGKMIGAGGGLALLASGMKNVLFGLLGRQYQFPRSFIPNFGRLRITAANFQMLYLAQEPELFDSMCRMARHGPTIVRDTYAPGTTMSQAELTVKRFGRLLGLPESQWSTGTVEGSILRDKLDAEFQNRVQEKTYFYMTELVKYMKAEGIAKLMEEEDVENMVANGKKGNTLIELGERYEEDLKRLLIVEGEEEGEGEEGRGAGRGEGSLGVRGVNGGRLGMELGMGLGIGLGM